jgi:G3E family GTPase
LNRILDIDPAFLKDEQDDHCNDSDCEHEDHKHDDHHKKEKKEKKEKPEQKEKKEKEHKKKHQHDKTTSSVGIHHEGEFDLDKLNDWMGMFLKTNGPSIYRMKGILAIKGMPRKFVFQGVHMLFDGEPTQPWAEGEKRESKVVFIGKKLNRAEIRAGLLSCVA